MVRASWLRFIFQIITPRVGLKAPIFIFEGHVAIKTQQRQLINYNLVLLAYVMFL